MNKLEASRFILSIIAPEYGRNAELAKRFKVKKRDFAFIIRLATRNGLFYYFLKRIREGKRYLDISEPYWRILQVRLSLFKRTIGILNRALGEEGLDYILIKMPTTIQHIPRDIDIFVKNPEKEKAIKALEKYRMKVYMEVYEAALIGDYWPVDVYNEIKYYKLVGIGEEDLWESRAVNEIFGTPFPGLTDTMNFLVTVLHGLFSHRRITLLDFIHLKNLMEKMDMTRCREYADKNGWGEALGLSVKKLEEIDSLLLKGGMIQFPYLPDINFILGLFTSMEGISLNREQRLLLTLLLIRDKLLRIFERTKFFDFLLKRMALKNFLNLKLSKLTTFLENSTKFK